MSSSVFTLTNRLNYLQAQVNGIIAGSDTLQEVIDNGDALQGSAPLANQVITYDGTNVVWETPVPPPADQTLQDVINEGDLLEGVSPTLDQVIKYDGTNVVWSDLPPTPSTPSLQEVINVSDDLQGTTPATNQYIKYNGTNVIWANLPASTTPSLQDVITVSDDLQGATPTLDQVVKYNGTNVVWSDLPAPPADQSLQDVINVSDVLNGEAPIGGQFIGYNGATPFWTNLPFITLDEVVIESPDLNGSPPTTNQVIQYDGEFVVWADLPAPPSTPSLQEVITVNDDLQSTAPTLDQVIKYNGTNVVWSDLPAPPATPTLASVLSAGNTASGASASIGLTNLTKQTTVSPTSIFLNDTTIVQQATLNTEKLRLLTSGLTNDITSDKMSFIKPATSSISEYGTDGITLTGLSGAESRSGSFNLNTGFTTTNITSKASGTLNESFVSLDSNNSSPALGTKSTLNATGLTCLNKVTQSSNSSLSSSGLTVGVSGSVLTASSSGLSSTNILNLNSASQIDTNCPIRLLAVPPASGSRTTISNGQVVFQNVTSALQNTISSTSSAITNGTKTITMTVDGLSSTGPMSLGTATVALTTASTAITQAPLNNSTKVATTSYVDTAISAIPVSATPSLQAVTTVGNTITGGGKTLTLNADGLNSTGEIVIGNDLSTTQLNGTNTALKLKSTNYDTTDPATLVKIGDSLTTGSLDLGKNITTGIVNLGTQMTTGNLNIMSNAQTTGSITMLKNAGTGKLFVYGGGIDTALVTTGEVKATNINPYTSTQDLKIGGSITNREIVMGENMDATGAIYIGSADSTINLVSNACNAVTQTTGDNTTKVATTAFVNSSISASIPSLQAVINKNDDLQGATPTVDQVIKYNGTSVVWATIPAPTTPSLQAVINVSDDLQGATPTTDQFIKYTGSAVIWSDLPAPPATPTLSSVLIAGNGAGSSNLNMNNQNITSVNNITVSTINNAAYPPTQTTPTLSAVLTTNNTANNSIVLTDTIESNTMSKNLIVIEDGANLTSVSNAGIAMSEPSTNKSAYYNLNDFTISKTVGTLSTSLGGSSDTLTIGNSDSVLLTSSTNQLTATGSTITTGTTSSTLTGGNIQLNDGTITTNLYGSGFTNDNGVTNTTWGAVKDTVFNCQTIVTPTTNSLHIQPAITIDSALYPLTSNIKMGVDNGTGLVSANITDGLYINSITPSQMNITDGTINTTYTNNSIVANDNLTIHSASGKLLNIGSSSATENVEIATQAGRSVVLHLGDGINGITGSGVHINNGANSVGNTQINNGSGQTGTINIGNATGGTTTTHIRGTTNIDGVVNINSSTNTGLITIGNDTTGGITTLSSDTINIGNSDTVTTMNASQIKQVIKTVGGTLIENIVGNTTVSPSMSVTFNRKNITPVGSTVDCYTITSNTADQFTAQYFEIFVSGSNTIRGAYTYKGCFGVEKKGTGAITASSVDTLFYYGTGSSPPTTAIIPAITFSVTGQILTVRVNTSGGGATNQNFATTLTSYPSVSIRGGAQLEDFIVNAI